MNGLSFVLLKGLKISRQQFVAATVTMSWLLWIILRTYCQLISILGVFLQVEKSAIKNAVCQ